MNYSVIKYQGGSRVDTYKTNSCKDAFDTYDEIIREIAYTNIEGDYNVHIINDKTGTYLRDLYITVN